jgi:predicted molibdopterin-dependent oxidoreductase YjgC
MRRSVVVEVPLRVHADIVVTSQMLVEGDDVVLLPVRTRYEQEGGGTSTTTERRIAFSPEIPRQVGEARSELRLYGDLATLVRPDRAPAFAWPDNRALRAEIAQVVPEYAGIEDLARTGDAVQWGGRHLCRDGVFPTLTGRGRFTPLDLPALDLPPGRFRVTTRRGKQFNSIVWAETDPLTGAGRDAVYMDPADAAALGLADGAPVELRSDTGAMAARVHLARLPVGTVQVHFPEGNVLLPSGADEREPRSRIPAYQAVVEIAGTLGA